MTVDGLPVPLKLTFEPTHIDADPVIVGKGFTVTVVVFLQPLLSVYVIILVPTEIAVTNPLLLTVATAGVEDSHGLLAAAVPEPVN